MAQQVAVVDGLDAEVLELPVRPGRDRVVKLARVVLDERRRLVADQPLGVAEADRLAERRDALPAHFLVDVPGQQAGGEPRVLRFLAGHLGRSLDRQQVKFGGGGAVVQPANGLGRDPQRIDLVQFVRAALDGADDLVHVDRLGFAVPLPHPHARRRWSHRTYLRPWPAGPGGLGSTYGPPGLGIGNRHRSPRELAPKAPGPATTRRRRHLPQAAACSYRARQSSRATGAAARGVARGALAGLRTHGRSVAVDASYRPSLPRLIRPSAVPAARLRARLGRLSFPFTAAGQSRIHTGFPVTSADG